MTRATGCAHDPRFSITLLSDDAAAQIYLFIEHILNLFEARYGTQISRFYESMSRANLIESDHNPQIDDPPF